ncbi:hypothetical protein K2X89_04460 [Myxococcota bacterium]|nr:hypothetical protein [Myxococcota bacterium]
MTARRTLALALVCALMSFLVIPMTAAAKDLSRVRVSLVNTGDAPAASGKAEFRLRKRNRMSFKVEAEDLLPADYDVTVGGVLQGVLDVRALAAGGVEGEIEFDTKSEPGHELLDFDPRGQLVTVERAGVVYLQVVFPPSTPAPGTCTP